MNKRFSPPINVIRCFTSKVGKSVVSNFPSGIEIKT